MEELFADFMKTMIYAIACLICLVFFVQNTFGGDSTRVVVDYGFEYGSQIRTIDTVVYKVGTCDIEMAAGQTVMYNGEQYMIFTILDNGVAIDKVGDETSINTKIVNANMLSYICDEHYWLYLNSPDAESLYYRINLNAAGGSMGTSFVNVQYNERIQGLPTPTRNDYTFDGWYTRQTGGTRVDNNDIYTLMENTTLFAHWSQKSPNTVNAIENQSLDLLFSQGSHNLTFTGAVGDGSISYSLKETKDSSNITVGYFSIPDSTQPVIRANLDNSSIDYRGTYRLTVRADASGDSTHQSGYETIYIYLTIR